MYEPRDCDDVRQSGSTESGVYSVTPEGTYISFDVYCDMGPGIESWLVSLYIYQGFIYTLTHLVLMHFCS